MADAELLLNHLDSDFKHRLAAAYGDSGFLHCLACGSCSASCPIRRLDGKYNPRRIIRMAILGMKEEVYRSEFVWLCSYHTTCLYRCPQGVNIGEVSDAVCRLAEQSAQNCSQFRIAETGTTRAHPDPEFKQRILEEVPSAAACFVCGSCSAVCPETLFERQRDPRRFIRKVNLALRDAAFADEFKEICATHFRCVSRCPQGVVISRIMAAIKACAVADGYSYPASLQALERRDTSSNV